MRTISIGLILAVLAILPACKAKPRTVGTIAPPAALALVVVGDVKVDDSPISTGARIQGDKWITVGHASFCDLQIRGSESGIVIRLTENSKFRLSSVLKSTVTEHSGELLSGQILVNVRKLGQGEGFKVKTPTAVASVRGTKFDVYVFSDGKVRTSVFEGTVAVRLSSGSIENLDPRLLEHSETLRAIVQKLADQETQVEAGKEAVVAHYVVDAETASTIEEATKISQQTTMTQEQIEKAAAQIDGQLKAKLDSIEKSVASTAADVKVEVTQRAPSAADMQFEEMKPIDVPLTTDETINLELDKRNREPVLRQKLFVRIEHVAGGKLDRLVLRNGTVVEGVVKQVIMDYVVTTPEGVVTVSGDDLKEIHF
ncbi:MAG: FecR domain-containing protein [Leptospirales bacterium]|nr:FecR domain-containing protein [Leptospirales bacterium]